MFIPKELCPVPFDQQPLNEYVALKKSCFFSWSILSINQYIDTIYLIFTSLFVLLSPFAFVIMYTNTDILQVILCDILIVTFIFIFIFIRLYLGWSYVIKRLVSATVFYEESGWYDGQIWIKSGEILTKDRLIGLYIVNPFIDRIRYSLLISICLCIFEIFIFYLL